LTNPSIF